MKHLHLVFTSSQFPTLSLNKSLKDRLATTRVIGRLIAMLLLFAHQVFSQDSRLKDLSGTYFIESEYNISGNIKRRLQIEEDIINDNESVVSVLSDGQEVFSGRRRNQGTEISGTWAYVHSSQNPQENNLQKDRSATLTFAPNGESFTITMRKIRVRPLGGLFANMVNAYDQTTKGVDQNTVLNNMQYEIVLEKEKAGLDSIGYIRKKLN